MSFLNLSPFAVVAGLVGLAGLLFALQRLRLRYQEVPVVTDVFWREAARDAPARVLRQRFRHPLAFLLILAICSLLWVGFAGPQTANDGGNDFHVLYLDGSAGMARGDALEQAVSALKDDLSALPEEKREVVWGGTHNLKILAAGEHHLLMEQRLDNLKPESVPSALGEYLDLVAGTANPNQPVRVIVYGAASVARETLDRLPAGMTVTRARWGSVSGANRGIVQLGVSEAISGDWTRVDVLVAVGSDDASTTARDDLEISIDGRPQNDLRMESLAGNRFLLRDVAANGGTFEVRLRTDDSLALDNVARLSLPERAPIAVAVSPSVPDQVRAVVTADRALTLSDGAADVAIRIRGEAFAQDIPALELAQADEQDDAFEIHYSGAQDAEKALRESIEALGLDQIDSAGLATATGRAINVSIKQGDSRRVSVWAELLSDDYNFIRSRSFPLFVSRAVRWIADARPWYPYLSARQAITDRSGDYSFGGATEPAFDALGAEFILGAAGSVQTESGAPIHVSLTNETVTTGQVDTQIDDSSQGIGALSARPDIVFWLMLAALTLLLVEWYFYQRGLMP